jgi:tripartite-type tricarboxylate transporter receptor subunit TctC
MRKSALCSTLAALAASLVTGLAAPAAMAQASAWPSRAIRWVVPFPPGTAPDQIARITAAHMQQSLGQPIVIDNKPGAQGAIGAQDAARSNPDGYTIFGGNNTVNAANPSLFRKLPYDAARDFVAVSRIITASLLLVVKPDFPARTVREFIDMARARPGKLAGGYASAGMQVSLAELRSLAGIDILEVPYKGVPQAVTDILGGNLAFTFADFGVAFPQVRSGKLRGLGVASKNRSSLMPEMPAMAEELPGFDVSVWNGIVVPAGVPHEIIVKLDEATRKAVANGDVAQKLMALGLEPAYLGPEAFETFITAERAKWARQIKAAGIEPE